MISILIIDDEVSALDALKEGLTSERLKVTTTPEYAQAIQRLKNQDFDIVITDLKLKDGSGIDILEFIRKNRPHTAVIIMTAFGSVDSAVQSIKGGAIDYLQKPFKISELRKTIDRLIENIELRKENEILRKELSGRETKLLGKSVSFRKIMEIIKKIAPSHSTVLITGESGTGKEVAASVIHEFSTRHAKPFIKINCGAIPENLVESELFGYEKGAFTGAVRQKKGKIELAHGGTLLLDEIGELTKNMQVKLLRVLQNGEYERLGSTETLKVDIRLIAATNADLEKQIADGSFREDLYYRLNVITVELPPLRERLDDIPVLAHHFLERYNALNHKKIRSFAPQVFNMMMQYSWKGNIRELENAIERAVVLSTGEQLLPEHFPVLTSLMNGDERKISLEVGISLAEAEKTLIKRTLAFHHSDKTKTARELGIGLATLYRKIKEFDISEG